MLFPYQKTIQGHSNPQKKLDKLSWTNQAEPQTPHKGEQSKFDQLNQHHAQVLTLWENMGLASMNLSCC